MIKRDETAKSSFPFVALISAVLKGTVGAYIFLVIAFGILSAVYTYTSLADSMVSPIVTAITVTSLVFGGILSSRNAHGFGWLHGSLSGILYTLIRVISGFAVFKSYVPDTSIGMMFLTGIILSAFGGIIGINTKKK